MPKKWNQDMKPSEKLLAMYTLILFSGREISLTELTKALDCSKQTASRLLDQMEAARFGKLLRVKHGREAFYSLERPKHLPKLTLDAEGLQQLVLCRAFLLHLLPRSVQDKLQATLRQASAYLPEHESVGEMESVGQAFAKGVIDYSKSQDIIHTLIEAIRQQRVCAVGYRPSIHDEERQYFFAPQKLIAYRESLYVRGWMVTDKGRAQLRYEAPANLSAHRLTKVEMTRRGTNHLPKAEDCSNGCFGLMNGDPFSVRVRFAPSAATYASERQWSDDQIVELTEDGSLILTMTARSRAEVLAWVLSFAESVEVLEPQWLRDSLAERAYKIYKCYSLEI